MHVFNHPPPTRWYTIQFEDVLGLSSIIYGKVMICQKTYSWLPFTPFWTLQYSFWLIINCMQKDTRVSLKMYFLWYMVKIIDIQIYKNGNYSRGDSMQHPNKMHITHGTADIISLTAIAICPVADHTSICLRESWQATHCIVCSTDLLDRVTTL